MSTFYYIMFMHMGKVKNIQYVVILKRGWTWQFKIVIIAQQLFFILFSQKIIIGGN